ncbi:MAG TPA: hypothetical protein EYP41_19525 [Anaerolineae bacterium]|nr:hypothetical protein [Anaerolineae bacterium]
MRQKIWFLLFLTILLAGCGRGEEMAAITPTAVIPPSPSATAAAAASPRPTASRTPVPPATATATPTLTLTPAFPLYTGRPLAREKLGVQVHLREQDQAEIFRQLQELGVGWVKVQISWKLYEPYPGEYHAARFAELDRFVDTAVSQNINVLLSVSKAPEWSRPTTEMDGPPGDFGLYRQFMQYAASRYQGKVAAYELWNEANLQREWNGFPLGGALFVDLLREEAAGARVGDANALLISGAPAVTGINDRAAAIDDRQFLQEMLGAGLTRVVDGVGAHPYGFANPPDSSYENPDTAVPSHNNHPSFFFRDTMADYHVLIGGELPIWATEFGWGSFDGLTNEAGTPQPPLPGTEYMNDVSEWQQAEYTLRAFEMGQEWEWAGPMFLWNLNFGPLLGTDFSETGYSLLRPDGAARPLYHTLKNAAKE